MVNDDFLMVTITHIINDNERWKKWIDLVEIKFYLNENIKWHCMQFEMNSIEIKVSLNSIEFKFLNWTWIHWFKFEFNSKLN